MNNLPKKKKPTINPFSCFIKDFQDSQKTKGIFYKNFEAAATEAKVIWDSLTEEEREYYKEKAKEQKTKIHGAATKYTTNGISFDEIDRQKMQQKKEIQEMEQEINSILQTAYINGNLVDQEFYFISTTDFCQTLQGDIFPAELAMIKFSLREGVMDSLHMHIDPGKLPLGFTADAQDKSDSTHKLKIPPFSEGISDFYEIYKQILNFVGSYPSGTIPAIYTNHMEVKVVRLTVAKILKEAERDKIFKIYPLEELFSPLKMFTMQIKGIKKKMLADKMIVRDVLQRDLYAYCSGLGCEFHDTVDSSIHCNLSKVKRWAFSIADYCFADLVGVEYKLGAHLPADANLDLLKEKYSEEKKKEKQEQKDSYFDKDSEVKSVNEVKEESEKSWSKPASSARTSVRYPDVLNQSTISIASTRASIVEPKLIEKPKNFMSYTTVRGRGLVLPKKLQEPEKGSGRGSIIKYNPQN